MGIQTRVRSRRSLTQRAGWMLGASALVLAIALSGCRAGSARHGGGNGASGVTVTQSATGAGSSSATGSSGSASSAALQQLEQIDSQNQTDQQQIGAAGSDASVDYSSQDSPIQP